MNLADPDEKLILRIDQDGKPIAAASSISGIKKIVIIINNQFTNSPNTTQIASGAGRNSTAGNNAAIDSSNTLQQQSVGAQGKARNLGMEGEQSEPHDTCGNWNDEDTVTIVINNQLNGAIGDSSATQVGSGGGNDSAGGTNAAVQSSNTKQQHAVAGDNASRAFNKGMDSPQQELPDFKHAQKAPTPKAKDKKKSAESG